jgi:CheY-like chemotaxis protein
MIENKPLAVVEDEETDALLLRLALEEAQITNKLVLLRDGEELIAYLEGQSPFENRLEFALPGLILLDLKMPRIDGFSVLSWLAGRPELANIPAVVFSASTCEADMKRALSLGASGYLSKPSTFRVLVSMLRELHERWLGPTAVQSNGNGISQALGARESSIGSRI